MFDWENIRTDPLPFPDPEAMVWKENLWRGTLPEFIETLSAFRDIGGRAEKETLSIRFADQSRRSFDSLSSFEAEMEGLNPASIVGFLFHVTEAGSGRRGCFGNEEVGFSLNVVGTWSRSSEALKKHLDQGHDRAWNTRFTTNPNAMPITIAWGLSLLLAAAFAGFGIARGQSQLVILGLALLGAGVGGLCTRAYEAITDQSPPGDRPADPYERAFSLTSLPEPGAQGTPRIGPVWGAKEWFERHPVVSLASILVAGALVERLISLIRL